MNKTVNISLAGIAFNIDEDAYELLTRYLGKIKQYLGQTEGREEIIADVESRIAELFTERLKGREVVNYSDVEAIIAVMGAPEAYQFEADDDETRNNQTNFQYSGKKRFYRNPDDKILGGVSSGIAAYFAIDTVFIRLLFVLLAIFGGSGFLAYFILWVIIPEAKTTAQKLEMRGEPVNIANIEKSIKEELDQVKQRVENFASSPDMRNTGEKMKSGVQRFVSFFIDALQRLFTFIFKLIGVMLMVVSIIALLVVMGITADGTITINDVVFDANNYKPFVQSLLMEPWQFNLLLSSVVLLIILPFIWLLLLALRILFNYKMENKVVKNALLLLPLLGLILFIYSSVSIAREFKAEGSYSEIQSLPIAKNNTLYLKMNPLVLDAEDFPFVLDGEHMYFHFVELDIKKADADLLQLETTYASRGRTTVDAREHAAQTIYEVPYQDSILQLDGLFGLETGAKYRGQRIKMKLLVPVGTKLVLDETTLPILENITQAVGNKMRRDLVGHTFIMTQNGLLCEDCPTDAEALIDTTKNWEQNLEEALSESERALLEAERKMEEALEKIKEKRARMQEGK